MSEGREPAARRGGAGHGEGDWDARLGARIASIRSIPPRTATGRGLMGLGPVRYAQGRHGPTLVSRNRMLSAPRRPVPLIPESAEPIVDIFDEGDCFLVVAELPGAEELSIRVELQEQTLRLWATGKFRNYRGEVALPGAARLASPAWTLNNGVINLRLARQKTEESGFRGASGQ